LPNSTCLAPKSGKPDFIGGTPEQLADMLKVEIRRWAEVAKSASLVGQ
jgi:hypothetical protein